MNSSCLTCSSKLREPFSWSKLFSFSIFQQELFPPISAWLCPACLQEMDFLQGSRCSLCSRPLTGLAEQYIRAHQGGQICYDCLRWTEWTAVRGYGTILASNQSALHYNAWAEEIMSRYKFRGDERLKYFFASLLIGMDLAIDKLERIDVVSSIPLAQDRLRERGFNQADQLARLFAEHYRLTYVPNLLLRLDEGEERQSKKGRTERMKDLLQKFIKNYEQTVDIYNKNILLVDDIYTTGATLYAAAYTLVEAGAGQVHSITVAR